MTRAASKISHTGMLSPKPDAEAVFSLRASARAYLFQIGELSLYEAVDTLQASAEQSGLVGRIGADAVQRILADAFAAVRDDLDLNVVPEPAPTPPERPPAPELDGYCSVCGCDPCQTPGFCSACHAADADPKVIAERERASAGAAVELGSNEFWRARRSLNECDSAAASTFNAVLHALRPPRGNKTALARQAERLSEFSVQQLESLIVVLKRLGADESLLIILVELLP